MARKDKKNKKSRKGAGRAGRNTGDAVAQVTGLDTEAAAALDGTAAVAVLADAVAPESDVAIVPPAPEAPPTPVPGVPTVLAPTAANAQVVPPAAQPAGVQPSLLRTGTHTPAAPSAVAAAPAPSVAAAPAAAPAPEVDPGDAAAAAGELDPGEDPPWYQRIVVMNDEDAAITVADWTGYAQAALAGGAESPDEAVADADICMHEQLKRHAILMARVAPAPPLNDELDPDAGQQG